MKVRICPKCGKHNPENVWACGDCGHTLSVNALVDLGNDHESSAPIAQPLSPNIMKLLQDLQSGNAASREAAAEQLGRLKKCDEHIINALETAIVSESNKHAKGAMEEALHILRLEFFVGKEVVEVVNESEQVESETMQRERNTVVAEGDVIYCSQCGTKLPQDAKFCYKCGNPIMQIMKYDKPKSLPSSVRTETVSPTKAAQSLRCPQCGKDDKMQKVSTIVASQTREISGGSWQTEVYVDKKGKKQSEDHYTPYSGTEMSVLAQRLSAPGKPDAGSNALAVMGAVTLLGISGLCGCIGLFASSDKNSGSIVPILIAIVCGLIGIVIWVSSNNSHQERVEQVQRVEIPRWEKAMVRWNQLYYCFRDDRVFIPSEKAVPISQMMEYIYRT